jgi:hypothetical protein
LQNSVDLFVFVVERYELCCEGRFRPAIYAALDSMLQGQTREGAKWDPLFLLIWDIKQSFFQYICLS